MENNPVINKYIDPMVDYGFKKIFKESGKKQLIIEVQLADQPFFMERAIYSHR